MFLGSHSRQSKPGILACIALAVLLVPWTAGEAAGRLDLVINGKAVHLDTNAELNERNWGLGVEFELNPASPWVKYLVANGFRDSKGDMSYMAGAGLKRRVVLSERSGGLYFDAGFATFLMVRKDTNDGKVFPGILPGVSLGKGGWAINLTYFPTRLAQELSNTSRYDDSSDGVFFLQLKVNSANVLPSFSSGR